MPVHTLHTKEFLVVLRNGGKPHKRAADCRIDLFRKLHDFVAEPKPRRAAADVDVRSLRFRNHSNRLFN